MVAKWHYLGRGVQGERRPRGRRKTSAVDVLGGTGGLQREQEGRDGTVMAAQGELCRSRNGDISTNAHPGRVHHPTVPLPPHAPPPSPTASIARPLAFSSSPGTPPHPSPPSSSKHPPSTKPQHAPSAPSPGPARSGDSSGNSPISAPAARSIEPMISFAVRATAPPVDADADATLASAAQAMWRARHLTDSETTCNHHAATVGQIQGHRIKQLVRHTSSPTPSPP